VRRVPHRYELLPGLLAMKIYGAIAIPQTALHQEICGKSASTGGPDRRPQEREAVRISQ
jgi:hypothetical protein